MYKYNHVRVSMCSYQDTK